MDVPLSRKCAKGTESVGYQRFPSFIISSHAGGHWFESSSLHQKVPDFVRNQELFLFMSSNSDAAFWRFSLDPNRDPKAERSGKHRRGTDGIIRPSPAVFVGYMVWLMTLPMAFRIFSWVCRKESGSNMVPVLGDTNRWGLCGCFACSSTSKNTGTLTDIQKPSCDPPKTSNHQGRDFRPSLGGCPAVCRNRGGLMPAG